MIHSDTNAKSAGMETLIQNAIESFTRHDYARAEQSLRQAIELDPRAIEPRYHLVNLCQLNGRIEEALHVLEPVKDHPAVCDEHLWLSFKKAWTGNDQEQASPLALKSALNKNLTMDRAREILEFARQSGSLTLFRKMVRMVDARGEQRDLKWIIPACLLLRIIPVSIWGAPLQRIINRFQQQSRWRRVQVLLTAALFAAPGNPSWIKQTGQVYRITRDIYDPKFLRERICYESVLRSDPNDGEALDGLLLTLSDMKAWSELNSCLEQIPPDKLNPWRRTIRAMCLANLGQYEQAKQLYSELEPNDSNHARLCQGLIALETGQLHEAQLFFQSQTDEHNYKTLNLYFSAITQQRLSNSAESTIDGQLILDTLPINMPNQFHGSNFTTQNSPCALCGFSGERQPLWSDTRSGWVRARCPQCSMISVAPIPPLEDILELYKQPEGDEKSLYLSAQQEVETLTKTPEEQCRKLPYFHLLTQWDSGFPWDHFEQSLGDNKRFLDIGCSAGKTVMLFQQCGWQSSGMDVDPDAITFAQSQGLQVRNGTIESLKDWLTTYHFITLVDVIEHLQDPAGLLRQIYGILEPGGLFYLKTPCADSLPHKFLGDQWLESCEHLHFFSRAALICMLEETGFQITGVKQYMDETTPYLHPQQWKQKFFPQLLEQWIMNTQSGDTIMLIAQKVG